MAQNQTKPLLLLPSPPFLPPPHRTETETEQDILDRLLAERNSHDTPNDPDAATDSTASPSPSNSRSPVGNRQARLHELSTADATGTLTERGVRAVETWANLTTTKSALTHSIEQMLQVQVLAASLHEAGELAKQGVAEHAGLVYKVKAAEACDWDHIEQVCASMDEAVQLAPLLDQTAEMAALAVHSDVVVALRKAALHKKERAAQLHREATEMWNAVHKTAEVNTRSQLAHATLLAAWEEKVEAALRKQGIEPES